MAVFRTEQGHQLYYELYGRPGDPLVTIINGLSMRTAHWAPYFKHLPAAGCQVLSYDMLGQGLSSKPVLGVGFDEHVSMLRALHAHLGIIRPYIMGISFGGVVALKYGIAYPDSVSGLLPVSTFSELDPQLQAHSMNLYAGLTRVGFDYYLDLLMPLNFSNHWLEQNQDFIGISKRAGVDSNELYGIQNLMESLANFTGFTDELPEIRCPTLILNAEYDYLTPRHLHDRLLQQVHNARLVLIQNACHAFTLERPGLTARIIAEFVEAVEQGDWKGDQTVWVAAEDPDAEPLLSACRGDHRRAIPMALDSPMEVKRAKPAAEEAGRPSGKKVREQARQSPRSSGKKPPQNPAEPAADKPIGGPKGGG